MKRNYRRIRRSIDLVKAKREEKKVEVKDVAHHRLEKDIMGNSSINSSQNGSPTKMKGGRKMGGGRRATG